MNLIKTINGKEYVIMMSFMYRKHHYAIYNRYCSFVYFRDEQQISREEYKKVERKVI